ncbi:MAG: hypothetical protein LKI53_01125 [Bacteroidales bacterium]|nr:hypothetical protein [Bacteroidales bacterium]
MKQIYDVHAGLHVVFTGSSILDINKGQADLSPCRLHYLRFLAKKDSMAR